MRPKLIELAEEPYLKKDLPTIAIGDSVSVSMKIIEGNNRERIQRFEGLVIAQSGTGTGYTVTVRKESSGVGVERVFLLHSPFVHEIKVLATGADVRKAKLYYLRHIKSKKKAKIKYQTIFKR